MTSTLVTQLRFASQRIYALPEGLTKMPSRLLPMNCISWMVGHLAVQEQFYWIYLAQGKVVRAVNSGDSGYTSGQHSP
ncbi:MAG: hypothetical protein H6656_10210 [Ardenticatenaceae bacterium]|nr:hypothetical protein [Ardenticatenaceae bacterium]